MKENEFAKRMTKAIRDCNGIVLSVVGNKMQQAAWPDIYVAHRYWQGWIEFKGHRTVLREDQRRMIEELHKRGVNAVVVRYHPEGCMIETEHGVLLDIFNMDDDFDLLKKLRDMS